MSTPRRNALEATRDQALRDLVELERQVADGELPSELARRLQAEYEATAVRAMRSLASSDDPDADPATDPAGSGVGHGSRARLVAYALAALIAVFAAGVLLPDFVADRPAGGFVTGNDSVGQPSGPRDPATISNAELEAVVAANPTVIGMRLALADRYVAEGNDVAAMRHYMEALRQQPRNPEAQAHLGWLLLQIGQPREALDYVNQALVSNPTLLDALWFKANIQFYGLRDAPAALVTLGQMREHAGLTTPVRAQVDELITAVQRSQSPATR